MIAHKEIIKTINTLKKNESKLSKEGVLKVLDAAKSITQHKETVDALIHFFLILKTNETDYEKPLTKRELQILKFIGNGESSNSIANKLNLSISTIETHRKNIRKKLKLSGNGKLLEFAIIHNLKQPSSKNL
ncbi:LuxR C-terminal-related transcriptional regulator [Jejuia pallidilutea]|jgi:DNA-binding NarL/FixJ family response regulator|uniref:Regulatory LuxR family protein n=1 Tax=Jejuia pallidilutea TaxID=504487 RepID=A0A090W7N7_9FLAO|nr:LuxR C-terminal-related transcriptional regulator [Jejuia pallidilutea]PQV47894.1 regulatory LuxR family protein [Jejuia pallidilutea]GAL72951.1 transcriptional regulator [Jejuia pallidilutea]GAL89983.1 transcriptional regulator [Jejuia pallidilutea]